MTSAFSKASVFTFHAESDAYWKRCVFKCLHFGECFQMFAISMKMIAFSDRFSVDTRTNVSKCMRFQTKTHQCGRSLSWKITITMKAPDTRCNIARNITKLHRVSTPEIVARNVACNCCRSRIRSYFCNTTRNGFTLCPSATLRATSWRNVARNDVSFVRSLIKFRYNARSDWLKLNKFPPVFRGLDWPVISHDFRHLAVKVLWTPEGVRNLFSRLDDENRGK